LVLALAGIISFWEEELCPDEGLEQGVIEFRQRLTRMLTELRAHEPTHEKLVGLQRQLDLDIRTQRGAAGHLLRYLSPDRPQAHSRRGRPVDYRPPRPPAFAMGQIRDETKPIDTSEWPVSHVEFVCRPETARDFLVTAVDEIFRCAVPETQTVLAAAEWTVFLVQDLSLIPSLTTKSVVPRRHRLLKKDDGLKLLTCLATRSNPVSGEDYRRLKELIPKSPLSTNDRAWLDALWKRLKP
jgi:hypothetical protein